MVIVVDNKGVSKDDGSGNRYSLWTRNARFLEVSDQVFEFYSTRNEASHRLTFRTIQMYNSMDNFSSLPQGFEFPLVSIWFDLYSHHKSLPVILLCNAREIFRSVTGRVYGDGDHLTPRARKKGKSFGYDSLSLNAAIIANTAASNALPS